MERNDDCYELIVLIFFFYTVIKLEILLDNNNDG